MHPAGIMVFRCRSGSIPLVAGQDRQRNALPSRRDSYRLPFRIDITRRPIGDRHRVGVESCRSKTHAGNHPRDGGLATVAFGGGRSCQGQLDGVSHRRRRREYFFDLLASRSGPASFPEKSLRCDTISHRQTRDDSSGTISGYHQYYSPGGYLLAAIACSENT